jgi:hypothetical protein
MTARPYRQGPCRARTGGVTLPVTPEVVAAIKAFHHDHHQREDGSVGVHTIRAFERLVGFSGNGRRRRE